MEKYPMTTEGKMNRRKAVGGFNADIGALAAAPIFDASGSTAKGTSSAQGLEDPTTKYLKPPFKAQSQPWPGLAGKMKPILQ